MASYLLLNVRLFVARALQYQLVWVAVHVPELTHVLLRDVARQAGWTSHSRLIQDLVMIVAHHIASDHAGSSSLHLEGMIWCARPLLDVGRVSCPHVTCVESTVPQTRGIVCSVVLLLLLLRLLVVSLLVSDDHR